MKTKILKSIALMAVTSILLLGLMGCPPGTDSGGGAGTGIEQKSFNAGGVSFKMNKIAEVTAGTNNLGHADQAGNKPHKASISAYMIGETEVTQELWQAVMGNNPSYFQGNAADKKAADGEIQGKRPVEKVNWYNAIAFCNKLTEKVYGNQNQCVYYSDSGFTTVYASGPSVHMNINKKGFRLPTEAEWEWAAKGGTEDKYAGTNEAAKLPEYAWYNVNSNSRTHEAAKLKPNAYGLYDMSGNVVEWCWDRKGDIAEGQDLGKDYTGAVTGSTDRVSRGGCYYSSDPDFCARASRDSDTPDYSYPRLGIRIVCRP